MADLDSVAVGTDLNLSPRPARGRCAGVRPEARGHREREEDFSGDELSESSREPAGESPVRGDAKGAVGVTFSVPTSGVRGTGLVGRSDRSGAQAGIEPAVTAGLITYIGIAGAVRYAPHLCTTGCERHPRTSRESPDDDTTVFRRFHRGGVRQ
jgi:hypothetical protein